MPTLVQAPGLEAEVADALRDELMLRNQDSLTREQPFYRLPDTANTQKVLNDYIKVYLLLPLYASRLTRLSS
jgi:hypothetical protein